MHIPRVWAKASGGEHQVDGQTVPVTVWGWGDDEASAKRGAADRLQRVLARIGAGEPFPGKYGYGNRPLKEEILQTIEGSNPSEPAAVITRNSYGAKVMNAARMLFLDIDLPQAPAFQGLRKLFGKKPFEETCLTEVRDVLQTRGGATYRIYRTASGFRAIAIDRDFDPVSAEVQELMKATATDPSFAQLCLAQKSFRARLTPKPHRIDCRNPPGEHPRQDTETRAKFASWLTNYNNASASRATCRYLETVGKGFPSGDARWLIDLHDRETRATENLPLA